MSAAIAGTGFEYAPMNSPLTWKIEWLYYNLERDNYLVSNIATDVVDARISGHLIRTGFNYRFNWAAPAAAVVARY